MILDSFYSKGDPDRPHRLPAAIVSFAEELGWVQFHNAGNSSMAIGVEVGELMHRFRWSPTGMTSREVRDARTRDGVEDETVDVPAQRTELAHVCGITRLKAAERKMDHTTARYPVAHIMARPPKHDLLDPDDRAHQPSAVHERWGV